jgi:type VI secretion system protein ImpH
MGPLDLGQYESFLPGADALGSLVAWLRTYLSFELEWDVCLVLLRELVPELRLGSYGRLGWTTWLGRYARAASADDLHLDAERLIAQRESPAVHDAAALQLAAG